MGRKIDMKKIEDVTKCQVTFSKRRSSLMKKANEIAICCDVDVAFVAFSPSGRVSKFCNKRRIEDLLHRYVNLPAESRLSQLDDVQRKLEKLKNLDHIKSDTSKLQYLDKQIENLELQIKKSGLQLQILEANLRDYELDQEQEPSLHLLSWCERNINHSLERVLARRSALVDHLQTQNGQSSFQVRNEDDVQFSSNFMDNELDLPTTPFSSKVRLQDMLDQANPLPNLDQGTSNISNYSGLLNTWDLPHSRAIRNLGTMIESNCEFSSSFQNRQQQPLVVDHTLLHFPQQDTVNAWNNLTPATYSNALYNSTQGLSTMPNPRSKIQKSNLWEWEDLLLDENFNFGYSK